MLARRSSDACRSAWVRPPSLRCCGQMAAWRQSSLAALNAWAGAQLSLSTAASRAAALTMQIRAMSAAASWSASCVSVCRPERSRTAADSHRLNASLMPCPSPAGQRQWDRVNSPSSAVRVVREYVLIRLSWPANPAASAVGEGSVRSVQAEHALSAGSTCPRMWMRAACAVVGMVVDRCAEDVGDHADGGPHPFQVGIDAECWLGRSSVGKGVQDGGESPLGQGRLGAGQQGKQPSGGARQGAPGHTRIVPGSQSWCFGQLLALSGEHSQQRCERAGHQRLTRAAITASRSAISCRPACVPA